MDFSIEGGNALDVLSTIAAKNALDDFDPKGTLLGQGITAAVIDDHTLRATETRTLHNAKEGIALIATLPVILGKAGFCESNHEEGLRNQLRQAFSSGTQAHSQIR